MSPDPAPNPLAYRPIGNSDVIGAFEGAGVGRPRLRHDHNLKSHPEVKVEIGAETLSVTAEEARDAERERLYRDRALNTPQFAEYRENAGGRTIPVIKLTPTGRGDRSLSNRRGPSRDAAAWRGRGRRGHDRPDPQGPSRS